MASQPKRESSIQSAVIEYARALNMLCVKLSFGEGWPDYMILYKGTCTFIEFKRKGEKPTTLQKSTHSIIRGQGFDVFVVDDADLGKALIRSIYGVGNRLETIHRADDQDE